MYDPHMNLQGAFHLECFRTHVAREAEFDPVRTSPGPVRYAGMHFEQILIAKFISTHVALDIRGMIHLTCLLLLVSCDILLLPTTSWSRFLLGFAYILQRIRYTLLLIHHRSASLLLAQNRVSEKVNSQLV